MRGAIIIIIAAIPLLLAGGTVLAQDSQPAPIDWSKAQKIHEKFRSGQELTPEEKELHDRAVQAMRNGRGPGAGQPRAGGAATRPGAPTTQQARTGMIPLCDMTAKYKGEDGGLYGAGRNDPPKEQVDAAKKALAQIKPLDKDGKPAADGKIVLLSVGMSNTTMEFQVFRQMANKDPDKNPSLVIVDGAQGGQAAKQWMNDTDKVWGVVEQRLAQAGVTAKQIQVVWLKQAQQQPAQFGDFPKHARQLKADIIKDIQQVKAHYPNVRVIYLSSRIYAGYARLPLNPEPYAYEGAFAVRWIIQDQIKGDKELNCDPAKGQVKAPVLLWGPYLWTDGTAGRKADKLVWTADDVGGDGTHPSPSGQQKVAQMLLEFFKTNDLAKSWFVRAKE